ncbi:MAG: hypothetical protein mread185_000547 [Mycoplasmataceae bacterium]|nr:MAG: hypothetical protein mread185_000547 [Mycoplasmataceae bacterium]
MMLELGNIPARYNETSEKIRKLKLPSNYGKEVSWLNAFRWNHTTEGKEIIWLN